MQAMRVLRPHTSPLHFFGAEVRRLRIERGFSLSNLGRELLVSADLVRRIETADRAFGREFVDRCDDVLAANGYLRRMWPALARERTLQVTGMTGELDGAFRGSQCDRPVLDWIIADTRTGGRRLIEHDDLGVQLSRLRLLDHQQGAGANYLLVSDALETVQRASPHAAVGFLELAGYEAVDLGADGLAQRHYLHALHEATRASDRLHGGYIVAVSLAHLALHCGDPDQAARLATAALHGTTSVSTPATRAAFLTVHGRALAKQGDDEGAMSSISAAECELDQSAAENEPPFIAYFGAADLADERAHAFFDLERFREAQTEARIALSLIAPERVRRRAIDSALLASALARTDDLEEACSVGTAAVNFAASIASFRSIHRIMLMLGHLQARSDVPVVRELFEYAHHTLPKHAPSLDVAA